MDDEAITAAIADKVMTLTTSNRPVKLNAWTQRMENEFSDPIARTALDEGARAIHGPVAGTGVNAISY